MLVPPDAAAKLMQIGQAIAIGFVDEDRVGVGNIESAFDDRRRQQQIELVIDEIDHHLLEFVVRHLAVADSDAGFGHDHPELVGEQLDIVDAIVNEVNLPAAAQFAKDRCVVPGRCSSG